MRTAASLLGALLLVGLGLVLAFAASAPGSGAAVGAELARFTPSPASYGRGLAIRPGSSLAYYTRASGDTRIHRVDLKARRLLGPIETTVRATYGFGALSWDPVRNTLWGAEYEGGHGWIDTINPTTGQATREFDAATLGGIASTIQMDGLAVDNDGTLWLSTEGLGSEQTRIFHVTASGALIGSFVVPFGNADIAVEGDRLWLDDANNERVLRYTKTGQPDGVQFPVKTGQNPEGIAIDDCTFPGKRALWVWGADTSSADLVAYEIGTSTNPRCPQTPPTTTTTTTTSTTTTTTSTPPPSTATPPVGEGSGTVTVGGRRFDGGTIPYGTTVDVSRGMLTVKSDVGTLVASGGGGGVSRFVLVRVVEQGRPWIAVRLAGGSSAACAARSVATIRALVVRISGRFYASGLYGSAAMLVQGSVFLIADRCDGTFVQARKGSIQVYDQGLDQRFKLTAGQTYVARRAGTPGQGCAVTPRALAGSWRVRDALIVYDAGGREKPPRSPLELTLTAAGKWSFGTASGRYRIRQIAPPDWKRWKARSEGETHKIVLDKWAGLGTADGPIQGSCKRVRFLVVISHQTPPVVPKAQTLYIQFRR